MRYLLGSLFALALAAPAVAQDTPPSGAPNPTCTGPGINDPAIAGGQARLDTLSATQRASLAARLAIRAHDYRQCGDLGDAANDLEAALQLDPHNNLILENQASLLMQTQKYTEAIADYTAILQHPGDTGLSKVYAQRALAEHALKEVSGYRNEIEDLNAALNNPSTPEDAADYRQRRATAYWEMGDYKDASADFAAILASDSDNWRSLYYFGASLLKLQPPDLSRAIVELNLAEVGRAPSTDPDAAAMKLDIELAAGHAYAARHGPYDNLAAYGRFRAALADSPGNAEANAGLAALPPVPPPPTFPSEPVLDAVDQPPGFGTNSPPTFCSPNDKFGFLGLIERSRGQADGDVKAINNYVTHVLTPMREAYEHSDMLETATKYAYLDTIDTEWHTWQVTKYNYYFNLTDSLLKYWTFISDDQDIVIKCDSAGNPIHR